MGLAVLSRLIHAKATWRLALSLLLLPFFHTLGEPRVTCCYPTPAGHLFPDQRHAVLLLSPRLSPHALTPWEIKTKALGRVRILAVE